MEKVHVVAVERLADQQVQEDTPRSNIKYATSLGIKHVSCHRVTLI